MMGRGPRCICIEIFYRIEILVQREGVGAMTDAPSLPSAENFSNMRNLLFKGSVCFDASLLMMRCYNMHDMGQNSAVVGELGIHLKLELDVYNISYLHPRVLVNLG